MLQALLELILGVRVVVTGDAIRKGERSVLIMNHRTRLDWMFFWPVLIRQSGVRTEKIILKDGLKTIPGAGTRDTTKYSLTLEAFISETCFYQLLYVRAFGFQDGPCNRLCLCS